ncbi:MAG: universal stress protein [Candidatus Heimdallarchaeota archaeon]|nr:universal stress protein [Candidatus Heimdallarchaeota archaeon]
MAIPDKDKQKSELEKTMQKFSDLLPSVKPEVDPAEKALVVIDGTAKSKAAVLVAGELNRHFGTKIDVICFYTEQPPAKTEASKESYESSLSFAYEHLKSKDFEIKGEVVENIDNLKSILDNVIQSVEYDIILVPSSFIGLKETKIQKDDEEDEEASITVLGDVFEYLLEEIKNIPVLLIESEKINLELLWKNIPIVFSNTNQLSYLFEKAMKYSLKKSEIHLLININPIFHEDKNQEELDALINRSIEDLEIFEKANSQVFKESSRYVDTHLLSTDNFENFKKELYTFGKDVGILIVYMTSKHSSLYGFFTELLEDSEITFPILIAKRKIETKKEEVEQPEEEGAEDEPSKDEVEEEVEVKEEEKEEEKIVIDESLKEEIKEEVKKDILGITEPSEEVEEETVEEETVIEKAIKTKIEEISKEEEEEMSEIDEIKEEVIEEVIEEIKKEVIEEVKDEPKKEIKKEVTKELNKEESIEELKESILEEIKEEIIEEIKYELKKDLKEPKKELKEKVIEEMKEEAEEAEEKPSDEEEEEEEEEVTSRMDFE